MKRIIALLSMLAFCAGCTTASRVVTSNSGVITSSTKVSAFLVSVTAFDDSIGTNGVSHTSLAKYSADTEAINAIGTQMIALAKIVAVASNTNLLFSTNFASK